MKDFVHNFKHFLTEAKSVYIAELRVKAQPGTRLYGRIFEAIRGIEGVTVIRSTEAIEKDQHNNKLMTLSVRFYVELQDDDGDKILSVSISKLPEKSDDLFR